MTLYLVRHGRPLVERGTPAAGWELDPAAFDAVWMLRERLPAQAAWFSSPEPKAVQTAQLLTDAEVGVLDDLREHERTAECVEDFAGAVRRAFENPDAPAVQGWEPLRRCRERVVSAVRGVLDVHGGDDVVLVGHGTAWTLVVAELTGAAPDVGRWESLGMPDVLVVEP
ncbi:histidine phosphatase family protein [Nocardioides sp. SYSU D00065]|uniref:histidine phosphatase family protein n=1 Tax=Nocardioides sp. SYSU D00065 TaxID=2817378 RepID=UPI001B3418DD|nr:histidine phosphatase family protein [Nocardioides sp. SYSU D00065]